MEIINNGEPEYVSSEPKRGTCDAISANYHLRPHVPTLWCVNWREGESAAAQPQTCSCVECQAHYGVPPTAETAITADQDIQQVLDFYNNWHDHSDDFTPDRDTVGLVLAYAAHVREAAQGEIAGLRRGFVNIYHFVTDKDCDPKIGIGMSTSAVCQLKEKCETAKRKLAELEKAADARINHGHSDTCDTRLLEGYECSCGHAALASLRAESKG